MGTDDEWGDFPEESKPDDSWGNFNEGPNESEEWGGFDHSSKIEVVTEQRTKESEVREIEFDDFSDDEFGDFGEADTKQETMADEVHEQSLSSQLERLEGVGENLINSAFGGKTKSWSAEKISSDELDLEKNVLYDGDIFQPMENPALTPGLDYKWRDSATYTIMLYTLGIDSRVVLDGEGWRSSVPRYAPKTAATLLSQLSAQERNRRNRHRKQRTLWVQAVACHLLSLIGIIVASLILLRRMVCQKKKTHKK